MSTRTGKADPNDWAKKRKEAIERAKQLREERKNGNAELDENYTFKPQVNKRPQYLGSGDALDNLAGQSYVGNPDDIFEQPLPGATQRKVTNRVEGGDPTLHGGGVYRNGSSAGPLSPSADSLGSEMKRYPPGPRAGGVGGSGQSEQFRSKFMQAYQNADLNDPPRERQEQVHISPRGVGQEPSYNPSSPPKVDEADAHFMSSLRGGKATSGPAWNDDFTSNAHIPPVPVPLSGGKKPAVSYRRRRSTEGATPVPPPPRLPPQRASAHRPEWNSDASSGIPAVESFGGGGGENIPQKSSQSVAAQSRLSLLKSKMRRSDSGSSLRSLSANSGPQQGDQPATRANSTGMNRGVHDDDFMPTSSKSSSHVTGGSGRRVDAGRRNRMEGGGDGARYAAGASDYAEDPGLYAPPQHGARRQEGGGGATATRRREQPLDVDPPQHHPPSHPPPRGGRRGGGGYDEMGGEEGGGHVSHAHSGMRNRPPASAARPLSSREQWDDPHSATPPADAHDFMGAEDADQRQCPDCGRKFNPIPYEKHIKICAKVFLQKRKAFDSKKMRIADNPELLKLQQQQQRAEAKGKGKKVAAPQRAQNKPVGAGAEAGGKAGAASKWKEQSKQFREAMRLARMMSQAEKTGAAMPEMVPSAPDPSLIPCPNCGRTFNERAAERHIPQCKNIQAKPRTLMRGSGGAGGRAGTGTVRKAKEIAAAASTSSAGAAGRRKR